MSINNDVKIMSRRVFCESLDPYVQKWTTAEILQFLELYKVSQAKEIKPDEDIRITVLLKRLKLD